MTQWLGKMLATMDAATVNDVFLVILCVVFLVSATRYWWARKSPAPEPSIAPNLLVSLGILGTFVGIVIGLLGFDPADIDQSIPSLLGGLKTAFFTSLFGMGLSISFQVIAKVVDIGRPARRSSDLGTALLEATEMQGRRIEELRHAIAGDEESSIAGQFKLARTSARDHAEALRNLLQNIHLELIETLRDQHGHLVSELRSAIAGDEESSIASTATAICG
jgi:hypothetical protein